MPGTTGVERLRPREGGLRLGDGERGLTDWIFPERSPGLVPYLKKEADRRDRAPFGLFQFGCRWQAVASGGGSAHDLTPLLGVSGRVNSAFLNISQHFTGHLFRLWIPSSARGQGGGPRRFTAIVLNVSRRRFGGPEGVEPQSPGEPGPRRGGPLFATWIRASFEKQPVRTVAQGLATRQELRCCTCRRIRLTTRTSSAP